MVLIILYRMCYKNPPEYNLRGAGAICPGVNRNSRGISGFDNPPKGGKRVIRGSPRMWRLMDSCQ